MISEQRVKKKIWQDPSVVGSVHQFQEIMIKKVPPTNTMSIVFLTGCGSRFIFNGFIPKVNQIIKNT